MLDDARYAIRGLRANPGFSGVVTLTLALGIGVNTAIFSIVDAVLLRPLPYADEDRLLEVANRWDGTPFAALSDPEYLDYAERSRTMQIAAVSTNAVNLTGEAIESERVGLSGVSPNFFDVMGVQPMIGRRFAPTDTGVGDGPHDVVILTYGVWKRRYGSDRAILGRTIVVAGYPSEVVGVMPEGFQMPSDFGSVQPIDLLAPQVLDPSAPRNRRSGHYLQAFGRLMPGATTEAASADMARIVENLKRQYPDETNQGNFSIVVRPLRTALIGPSRPILLTLMGAVGLVLLIACANVANLLLARGEARRRELAVRTALGASRLRIVRLLLTESLLLALAGAMAGLGVVMWCQQLVLSIDPTTLPRVGDVRVSGAVLAFASMLGVATAIACGLLPAIHLVRLDGHQALAGRGTIGSIRSGMRAALVAGQVAVAVVLVVAAGLLVQTFINVVREPAGIRADHVLTLRLSPAPATYQSQLDINRFFEAYLDRLRALPGVHSAGASTGLPLAYLSGDWSFDIEGRPFAPGKRHSGAADWYTLTPGYFESLRVALRAGRFPAASDRSGVGDPAIFLNEAAARQFFPGGDAIGHRLKLAGRDQPWRTIAGVVGDVRYRGLDTLAGPEMYIPLAQFRHFSETGQARGLTVVIRSGPSPSSLIPAVRAALRGLDDSVPASRIRDMDAVVRSSVANRWLTTVLMGSFGVLALSLAAIGIYGVMSYQVAQRTRELGVRLALGASPDRVRRMVIGDGLRLVAIGLTFGTAGSLALAQVLSRLLFGVAPRDVATLGGAAVSLALVGFIATYLPAARATRVDPMVALRAE